MKIPKDTVVAIFAYNRPSHLRRVLIALEDYRIYNNVVVYVDGPKNEKDENCQKEIMLILNTKAKSEEIKIIRRKINLGLANSILRGVDDLFKRFRKVIVLEDDCIPRKKFFEYTIDCLNFYENNKIISAVCAYQIPKLHSTTDKNLKTIFLNNFSSWGWSTWRDRWNEYKTGSVKKNMFNHNLISKIDKIVKNKKNIWTRDFMLHNYIKNKIYVFPNKSLVKNIGFDGSGINSKATYDFTTEYSPSKKIILSKKIEIDKNMNNVQERFIYKNLYQFY